jgi:hypothetical protein
VDQTWPLRASGLSTRSASNPGNREWSDWRRWQHLTPGDMITMHEIALPIATAEIITVLPPPDRE